MNPPRANKTDTPPKKTPAKLTAYEISVRINTERPPRYERLGIVEASGAHAAIRAWAERAGESFAGGHFRAVPASRITELEVKVETKRQLTLGTPAS